jgi:hypothetical protein
MLPKQDADSGTADGLSRAGWLKIVSCCVNPEFVVEAENPHHRKYRRYDVGFGTVRLLAIGDQEQQGVECRLHQISLDGLAFGSETAMPVHTPLQMEVSLMGQTFRLSGEVIHRIPLDVGLTIGIRLLFSR